MHPDPVQLRATDENTLRVTVRVGGQCSTMTTGVRRTKNALVYKAGLRGTLIGGNP